jgi:hypothetical protein
MCTKYWKKSRILLAKYAAESAYTSVIFISKVIVEKKKSY